MRSTLPYAAPRRLPAWLQRWRLLAAGLAAALALTFLGGTPDGRTAAAQFLAQFRGQRFVAVTFDATRRAPLVEPEAFGTEPGDLRGGSPRVAPEAFGTVRGDPRGLTPLVEPEALGTVRGDLRGRAFQPVASAAEAAARVGFPVKQPKPAALPAGVNPTPRISTQPASEVRFTFDRERARTYFRANGHPEVDLPARYDGTTLVVGLPAAVFLQYSRAGNDMAVVVGQAGELAVGVEGDVSLAELREFLLGLPGLPPDAVQQLRAIQDWRNTLPIPVPVDRLQWQQVTVAGGPGLLLADNTGLGSGVIWQRDGRVYLVAGTTSAAEVQRVADSLQ